MEYLSVKELTAILKISKPTLYRMTSQKLIPHSKIGQRVVFDPDAIRKWVAEKTVPAGARHE
jgi:excisionase family DNA binding protein